MLANSEGPQTLTSIGTRPSYLSAENLAKIRSCFSIHKAVRSPIPDWLLADTAHCLFLMKNSPRDFLYSKERAELSDAVRKILKTAPMLIAEAQELALEASRAGRATNLDRFAEDTARLLRAAETLKPITRRLNPRGDWHGAARILVLHVQHILQRQRPTIGFDPAHPINRKRFVISFAKPTSPAVLVLARLLALAGFNNVTPAAIVEELRSRDEKRG